MAIKMQVLHYPEKGKVATIATTLGTEYQVKFDKIPPAYGCTRERVVFIGISSKTKILDCKRQERSGAGSAQAVRTRSEVPPYPQYILHHHPFRHQGWSALRAGSQQDDME